MTETTRYRYDLVEPPENPEEAFKFYIDTLVPLMDKFWATIGKERFRAANWELPPLDFVNLWKSRHCLIMIAYEGSVPVGFLFGMKLRPFIYSRQIIQVEPYFGITAEIEEGLIKYLFSVRKYLDVDDVVIPEYDDKVKRSVVLSPTPPKFVRTYKGY